MDQYVVAGDFHVPFEDKKALSLLFTICDHLYKRGTLTGIILNGDIADFYFVNSYGKDPDLGVHLKDEQIAIHRLLRRFKESYPASKKVFIQGNHEARLQKFFKSKCPELFGLISLEEFLQLDYFEFEHISYTPNQAYITPNTDILIRHEGVSNGVGAARMTALKSSGVVIFSHTHQISEANMNSLDGKELMGLNIGCMCDFKNPKAPFQYVKNHHQWRLGFCVISVIDSKLWFAKMIKIKEREDKYYCLFEDSLWETE